jgi:FemAB-related protein (PEP-CTERM system-associated)
MDVKKLLKNPEILEAQLHATPSTELAQTICSISEEYCHTWSQLKNAQQEKRDIARQFKAAKENPEQFQELKSVMTEKSNVASALEHKLSSLSARALEAIEQEQIKEALFPGQFRPVNKQLNQQIHYEICSTTDQRWSTFVHNHPSANAYHQPAIQDVISTCFNYTSNVLLALSEGAVVGGLPLTYMHTTLFGHSAVSVPYFNYGGPLSSYIDVQIGLISQARQMLQAEKVSHIEIRTTQPNLHSTFSDKKTSMILALAKDEQQLDKELGSKVRAQINKAYEYQPEAKFGCVELLDDFYKVFAINMRDLGTPVYSKEWFRSLLNNSDINSKLIVCYLRGEPVSCGFLLGYRDLLEIPWASTLKKANGYNMNMWMYRQILGYAIQQGFHFFDFGRSTKSASTYRFKKQWGAKPVPHYWYYVSQEEGVVSETNPDNPKYRLMIAIWKKLPVWLTKLIGPSIVKQIA